MIRRTVEFADEARADLNDIAAWIADDAGLEVALRYIDEIEEACRSLDLASERGTARNDVRPGLRVIGYGGSATIVFRVSGEHVDILRISYRGRNWERDFD